MKLCDYLRKLSPLQRYSYADRAKTSVGYLYQVAGGHKRCGGPMARQLAAASDGFVSVQELRPDLFGDMQPILEAEGVAIAQRRVNRMQEEESLL